MGGFSIVMWLLTGGFIDHGGRINIPYTSDTARMFVMGVVWGSDHRKGRFASLGVPKWCAPATILLKYFSSGHQNPTQSLIGQPALQCFGENPYDHMDTHMDIHCMSMFHHFSRWNLQLPVAKKEVIREASVVFATSASTMSKDLATYGGNMRWTWGLTDDSLMTHHETLGYPIFFRKYVKMMWKWCYKLISMLAKVGSIPY